jgi:hypothetical protein
MMDTKATEYLKKQWDNDFPQFAPDEKGVRVAVVRCIYCMKPLLKKGEICCVRNNVIKHYDPERFIGGGY